ncbi:MAG: hypothetical protein RMJ98_18450, partial [Myxococcales bacterium]|nr:hypothetical protein [Polyangiaceae bacterium]MDW8251280.1 hypothetical protein [Myxococcales bacterium]
MNPPSLQGLVLLPLLLTSPSLARADGAYGRLDGDLAPSVEVGVALGSPTAVPVVQGRLLYLGTAGLQASWLGATAQRAWSSSLGAEIRPLFLPRFL